MGNVQEIRDNLGLMLEHKYLRLSVFLHTVGIRLVLNIKEYISISHLYNTSYHPVDRCESTESLYHSKSIKRFFLDIDSHDPVKTLEDNLLTKSQ